jgi:hypothetical protein
MANDSPANGSPLKRCPPHRRQNSFGLLSGVGWNASISSFPATSRNPERASRALSEDAVPVRRWQWVQWQ